MKCKACGSENDENATYCRHCGVNLKESDLEDFKDDVEVLNQAFKVSEKRQPFSVSSSDDSIITKLFYKRDRNTGQLRIAKARCISIVVFFAFFIFAFTVPSSPDISFFAVFLAAIIVGLIFAVPTYIIGFIIGWVIDRSKN
jgi:uncharacterized membrane protein YvbJ